MLVYGGLGAAFGVLVDSQITERLPVYRASGRQSAQVTVAPLLGRDRKGVAVTLKWGRK